MKLDHLTFGQLYQLAQPETLMRVTATYHSALRTAWDAEGGHGSIEDFSVSLAEAYSPEIKKRYSPKLSFLQGLALKTALRKAADAQTIRPTPGRSLVLRTIETRRYRNGTVRSVLADLIMEFCRLSGVRAWVREVSNKNLEVHVETDAWGVKLLWHRSGLRFSTIMQFCLDAGLRPGAVFFWLDDYTSATDRINPLVAMVNTPDVHEIAAQFVHND